MFRCKRNISLNEAGKAGFNQFLHFNLPCNCLSVQKDIISFTGLPQLIIFMLTTFQWNC